MDGPKLRKALDYLVRVGHPRYTGIGIDEELLAELQQITNTRAEAPEFDLAGTDFRTTAEASERVVRVDTETHELPRIEGKFISRSFKLWKARAFPNVYPRGRYDSLRGGKCLFV